jgi:rRNA processing protein Gar1
MDKLIKNKNWADLEEVVEDAVYMTADDEWKAKQKEKQSQKAP